MRKSESKAPLVLMEQVIMVLVFALVAAMCIQAFALARSISLRMAERDHAMNISQTLAETVKAYGGSLEEIRGELGGVMDGEQLVFYYDDEWNAVPNVEEADFCAVFVTEESEALCRYGSIIVSDAAHEREIFSMRVAWQGAESE